MYMTSTAIVL